MAAKFYGRTFVILFIELFLVILSECCIQKTEPEPKAEEMVFRSDYVLYGKVLEKITDPRTPKLKSTYGIRFEVYCIYKGDSTSDPLKEKIITIAGGGEINSTCYSMKVEVNDEPYVLFLNKEGSHIVPSYGAPKDITKSDIYELVLVCDLIPYAPGGAKLVGEEAVCPATDPKDCVTFPLPTEPPKKTTIKVEKPVPLPLTPATKNDTTPADKEQVQGGDKGGLETKDNNNNSATLILTSMFSLVICLLSAMLMS